MDELIFHIQVPLKGTDSNLILSVILKCLLPTILVFITLLFYIFYKFNKKTILTIEIFKININTDFKNLFKKCLIFINICLLLVIFLNANEEFGIIEYIKAQNSNSNFIEENYVDSKNIKLEFPETKRNLIYIYLESMENTYSNYDNGGIQHDNYISELDELAKNNINFSNNDNIGGALHLVGTAWTIGAMVAQTSGIGLSIPIECNSYDSYDSFLPGAYSLGDILNKNGYTQMLMVGSEATFAGRASYFKNHGDYIIKDYNTAKKDKIIEKDHSVFWGMEDSYLIKYAKKELTNLSKSDKPFNFTMLTVNTHGPNGNLEDSCDKTYSDYYANTIACSSKQISNFINWIKEQDFYNNTTIIIAGDHLTMATTDIVKSDNNYTRTTFNTIINSPIEAANSQNRLFSNIDMFPTTLASLGVKIDGNKLALGINLFSNEKTIIEEYGYEKVNNELSKKSNFYNSNFLYYKDSK
ncbi:MAG TPA: LTA synthase family protein [Bacilli bacterium]|nr:LTA synthase family protein [Bacilli bacterium]